MSDAPNLPVPSVARMVHYVSYGTPGGEFLPEHRAAVIAGLAPDPNTEEECDLVVFNPQGIFFNRVRHSEDKKPGTWHWPERI